MALLFTETVFDKFVTDTASYSDQPTWAVLGSADKLLLEFVGSNISGAQPNVSAYLEDSNDGVNWNTDKLTLFSGTAFADGTVVFADDDGTTPSGRFVRVKVVFDSSSNSGQIKVIAAGRSV